LPREDFKKLRERKDELGKAPGKEGSLLEKKEANLESFEKEWPYEEKEKEKRNEHFPVCKGFLQAQKKKKCARQEEKKHGTGEGKTTGKRKPRKITS